jgi:hypothetical protein
MYPALLDQSLNIRRGNVGIKVHIIKVLQICKLELKGDEADFHPDSYRYAVCLFSALLAGHD